MVTSLPSTTELENQAKVQKCLVKKEFVLQNRLPPATSKIWNFPTALSQYPHFQNYFYGSS